MSNSPPTPGPDLFLSGGASVVRYGVLVRRTDADLEEATREKETRGSNNVAWGRDSILRLTGSDIARVEWLSEVDFDPTRNTLVTTDLGQWSKTSITISPVDGDDAVLLDESASVASNISLAGNPPHSELGDVVFSCLVRHNPGGPSCNVQFTPIGVLGVILNPDTGEFITQNSPTIGRVTRVGAYWKVEVGFDQTPSTITVRLYPAWGAPGVLNNSEDVTATGSNRFKEPQMEANSERTDYQATPRDFDRKTPSIFLEESVTNEATSSEDLTAGAWLKRQVSIAADLFVAPDGTQTMDGISEDLSLNTHGVIQTGIAISVGGSASVSFYVRQNTRVLCFIRINSSITESDRVDQWFHIADRRELTFFEGGSATKTRSRIVDLGDGLVRVSLTADLGGAVAAFEAGKFAATVDGEATYQGVSVGSIGAWGGQMEADRANPSSYIKTGGAIAARSPDVFSDPFPHPPQPMSIYLSFIEEGTIDFAPARLFQLGSNSNVTTPLIYVDGGDRYRVVHDSDASGNSNSTIPNPGSPEVGDFVELLIVLFGDGSVLIAQRLNGGEILLGNRGGVQTLGEAWAAPTRFYVNSGGDSLRGFNRFVSVKVQRGARSLDFMANL